MHPLEDPRQDLPGHPHLRERLPPPLHEDHLLEDPLELLALEALPPGDPQVEDPEVIIPS